MTTPTSSIVRGIVVGICGGPSGTHVQLHHGQRFSIPSSLPAPGLRSNAMVRATVVAGVATEIVIGAGA